MTSTRLRVAIAIATAALALATGARPAAGEPSPPEREARRHFDEAEAQYRAGHYSDALAQYQAGYAAMPLSGFLVNIAQCQRRLGNLKTARATYREFVLVAPDSRLVPEVQTLIRQLDVLIADLASGGSGAGAAQLGAGDAAYGDVHATDPTAPPAPSLTLTAPATTETALVATSPQPAPARRSRARWWIWGAVAVAAIAGGVVAGMALASSDSTTVHAGSLGTLSR
jgi:hypothetical protein